MLKPGDSFGRYTIVALLGQGGMGAVYRAHDPKLGRNVAVKVIADGAEGSANAAEAKARLLREARAAAALDHPNAVAIFDVGESDGTPYIVMELVEGRTLRRAPGDGPLSIDARVTRLADVARALAGAHRRGLVHRDIKPENVMVRDDGMVKVLDFGIARRASSIVDPTGDTHTPALATLTIDGAKLGTPVYMAPEQIRGDTLDGRADQFSWAVLAYELLAGRLPWRGASDALAVMASALTDAADPAPLEQAGVPRGVRRAVLRALAKKPEERFSSMDDVVSALESDDDAELEPAPGRTMAQRFSTGDVREVLSRAVEEQAKKEGSTKLRFEDLLAVAAEIGVDEASLRDATRALRAKDEPRPLAEEDKRRDAWLRRQRRDFRRHAGVFVIVNAGLLLLGLVLLSFTPWWIWFLPLVAWSVGLAIHGLLALNTDEDDWREHEEGVRHWEENRRRRHEVVMAAGPTRRVRDEEPRARIKAAAAPERAKVRVADTGGEREREAEEEADQAARSKARRRR